jgi:hypothetical protein
LSERTRVGVHAPDFHGNLDRNTLLTAVVHGCGIYPFAALEMVEVRSGGSTGNWGHCTEVPKVTPVGRK